MNVERDAPPCINGFYIPQYYRVDDRFNIAAAPRSGSTSLYFFAQRMGEFAVDLKETPEEAVCIIRDPIKRLASAYMLLPVGVKTRDPVTNFKTVGRPAFEETIDAVLDDAGQEWFDEKIGNSAHAFAWQRQSELYSGCKNPIWLRLEGNEGFYGYGLPRENVTTEQKPEVTYRLEELEAYYAEDIKLWKTAATKIV